MGEGILSPLDIDEGRARGSTTTPLNVQLGMVLMHQATQMVGAVVRYVPGQQIILRDDEGRDHVLRPQDGAFSYNGVAVALRKLVAPDTDHVAGYTASGSIDVGHLPARIARGSRIYVEGIHDAELIEKVWGDDLRVEGVVVEQMEGADDLAKLVRSFQPGPRRRLGVLLDHLIDGTKETIIAATVDHPDVLICGHPYVDIWEAIRPATLGFDAWPVIPRGQSWKEGVLEALGSKDNAGLFWKKALGQVNSFKDLETPLINAVEQLIDFVAVPDQ